MIAIIDYGMGNLFSIYNGLKRVYDRPLLVTVEDIARLREARGIIVPGVGAFDDCVRNFRPFSRTLTERVEAGIPVLGICIGMQLLFDRSAEGREAGLGLIPGDVIRLPPRVRVPHMGWNNLHILKQSELLEGITEEDYFYFVHSYHCVPRDAAYIVASTDYGIEVTAVVQRDNLFGVQFHPEKSSTKGLRVLQNFAQMCGR